MAYAAKRAEQLAAEQKANETNNQSSMTTTLKVDPLAALRAKKAAALTNPNMVSRDNSATTSSSSELAEKIRKSQENRAAAINEVNKRRDQTDVFNVKQSQKQINDIDAVKITAFVDIDQSKPFKEVINILGQNLSGVSPINIDVQDKNTNGMTALMFQSRFGTIEAMNWLLTRDPPADPNIIDDDRLTAIMHAVLANDPTKVKLLMERGARYDKDELLTTANFIDGNNTEMINYINRLPQRVGVGGRKTKGRKTKGRKTKGRKTKGRKTRKPKRRRTTRRRR